jgi:hypothetical protein
MEYYRKMFQTSIEMDDKNICINMNLYITNEQLKNPTLMVEHIIKDTFKGERPIWFNILLIYSYKKKRDSFGKSCQ